MIRRKFFPKTQTGKVLFIILIILHAPLSIYILYYSNTSNTSLLATSGVALFVASPIGLVGSLILLVKGSKKIDR